MDILVGTILLCFLLGLSFAIYVVEKEHKECVVLRARVAELTEALEGVVRVADRKTAEFDRAREALKGGT